MKSEAPRLLTPDREAASHSCPSCGHDAVQTTPTVHKFPYRHGDQIVELCATVPLRRCLECGIEFLDSEAETIQHEAVCRHLGVMTPDEVQAVRRKSGSPSRSEFARITRLGEATIGRWERGELIQNAANDQLLYLLTFPENVVRLRDRVANGSDSGRASSSFFSGIGAMSAENPSSLAMASGDLYVKLLRTILEDRRVPDRQDPTRSRLARLQNAKLISQADFEDLNRLLDSISAGADVNAQMARVDEIRRGLVDRDASPVAIAIAGIASRSMNSEHELLDTPTRASGEWRSSPESGGDAVYDQVAAAIAGACLAAELPGGDASTAIVASIAGAAIVTAFFQP